MRVINAEVLGTDPVSGDGYYFDRIRLFDRESEQIIEARCDPKRYGTTPRQGDSVDAVIAVSLYQPRNGGVARIQYELTRPLVIAGGSKTAPSTGPVGVPPARTGTTG